MQPLNTRVHFRASWIFLHSRQPALLGNSACPHFTKEENRVKRKRLARERAPASPSPQAPRVSTEPPPHTAPRAKRLWPRLPVEEGGREEAPRRDPRHGPSRLLSQRSRKEEKSHPRPSPLHGTTCSSTGTMRRVTQRPASPSPQHPGHSQVTMGLFSMVYMTGGASSAASSSTPTASSVAAAGAGSMGGQGTQPRLLRFPRRLGAMDSPTRHFPPSHKSNPPFPKTKWESPSFPLPPPKPQLPPHALPPQMEKGPLLIRFLYH